jgi:hypothetical protein
MKFTPYMNSWQRGTPKNLFDSLFPRAFLGKKKKRERGREGEREIGRNTSGRSD